MKFLQRYITACGQTFTPPQFHRWACLSLVAAALADSVAIMKLQKPLYPNLYVMLVGPSGCGKGEAIDMALGLANRVPLMKARVVRGALTKQGLIDTLAGRDTMKAGGQAKVAKVIPNPFPWIVYPELYNSLGAGGPVAEQFIANMTDMYTPSPVQVTERTRTWGEAVIERYCLNWLCGTTKVWLQKSVPPHAIESGVFGRVVTIQGGYQDDWVDAAFPANHSDLLVALMEQLQQITCMRGEMILSEEAQMVRRQWMQTREVPLDPLERPMYQRDDDMFLKLGMILAACDGAYVINREHAIAARDLTRERWGPALDLIRTARQTPDSTQLDAVKQYIMDAGRIDHSTLVHRCSGRGILAKQVRVYVETLRESGRVIVEPAGRKIWYRWQAGPAAAVDPPEAVADPA